MCITLIITPASLHGHFDALLQPGKHLVRGSRQPLLDSARRLTAQGHDPHSIIVMKYKGSDVIALRSFSTSSIAAPNSLTRLSGTGGYIRSEASSPNLAAIGCRVCAAPLLRHLSNERFCANESC